MRRWRSFICLRPVTLPCWHNPGDGAGVPPHQTPMKEGEKERGTGTDAERRITMRAEIRLCIKAKHQRKKKLPLKLIIYPREEKPQPLPSFFPSSGSHGANCLRSTSVYIYTLLSEPVLRERIQKCSFSDGLTTHPKALLIPTSCIQMKRLDSKRPVLWKADPTCFLCDL